MKTGDRVELHPATDAWMAGDRYGTVLSVGHRYIRVQMDRSRLVRAVLPQNISGVIE